MLLSYEQLWLEHSEWLLVPLPVFTTLHAVTHAWTRERASLAARYGAVDTRLNNSVAQRNKRLDLAIRCQYG